MKCAVAPNCMRPGGHSGDCSLLADITETDRAIYAANEILDKPYVDPDGDMCILARQFMREREARERAESALASAIQAKNAMQIDCQTAQHQAEEFQGKWVKAESALREALIPLAILVTSGACVNAPTELCDELKQAVLKGHDAALLALKSGSGEKA